MLLITNEPLFKKTFLCDSTTGMFIVTPIVEVCNCSMFSCTLLYVHSSIAIILMGKRELIALLNLSSWCLVMVYWLFLAVPRGSLQFVIVVFPDHTHYYFSWLGSACSTTQTSKNFACCMETPPTINNYINNS